MLTNNDTAKRRLPKLPANTPARRLCKLFGGVRSLAREVPIDVSVVSRWSSDSVRGNMGRVPTHYNIAIMEAARRLGLDLDAVKDCLDAHECPCCKRPLEPGVFIDREHLHRVLK